MLNVFENSLLYTSMLDLFYPKQYKSFIVKYLNNSKYFFLFEYIYIYKEFL